VEEKAAVTTKDQAKVGRRDFLRGLGAGAGIATASASLPTGVQADSETNDEKRKSRYRETEHVKMFYRVNGYPTKR
jgi:hypothetical protein